MKKQLVRYCVIFILLVSGVLTIFTGEEKATGESSTRVTLKVPYHQQIDNGYSGEASLEMVFDYFGEDINQKEIKNVTGNLVNNADPIDLVRASHFSYYSRAKLNPSQQGYYERVGGYGYAAFHYNWGRDGLSDSPRFNERFDDLRGIISDGFPVILQMRESADNPILYTYRVVIGYDQSTHEFILDDPLPSGQGDLGGMGVRVSENDLDTFWNVSGGARWGMITTPWQVHTEYPDTVGAGEVFTISENVTYPCPEPFPKDQYPISQLQIEEEFTNNISIVEPIIMEGNITYGGDYMKLIYKYIAPDVGNGLKISITHSLGGNISGSTNHVKKYSDIIGVTKVYTITVKGYVDHPPEISRAWVSPGQVMNDGESKIDIFCSASDRDGNLVGVTADLRSIGGIGDQRLYDDGTHGDGTVGDGVYSYEFTVPRNAKEGNHTITFTASDSKGLTATAEASLMVKNPYISTSPPKIISLGVSPKMVPPDDYTEVTLWAKVVDPDEDVDIVYADLSSVGGKKETNLRDDGNGGDPIAHDENYTHIFTIPLTVFYGEYNITVTAQDKVEHITEAITTIYVIPPPEPPVVVYVKLNRTTIPNDGVSKVLLTTLVKDPNNDVNNVYADLSPIGGELKTPMNDAGINGDRKAGDGIYSLTFSVGKEVSIGRKTIQITAEDKTGGIAKRSGFITVFAANHPPMITTFNVPEKPIVGDGKSRYVVEVKVQDTDKNVERVYLNLSSILQNWTVELNDNGLGADKTAGDGMFSAFLVVPKDVPAGKYTIKAVAVDSYGESSEVNMVIEIKEPSQAKHISSTTYIWIMLIILSIVIGVIVIKGSGRKKGFPNNPPPSQGQPAFVPTVGEVPIFQPVR